MRATTLILISLILTINTGSKIISENDWVLSKNENGIKVFTRSILNSEIKEFKVISEFDCDIKVLEKLVDNVSEYPIWQSNVKTAKLLKTVNANEKYIYYTSDVPWPVSDRDIIVYSTKTISSSGKITWTLESKPDFIKEKENFIRLIEARGKWEFTPLENGKIKGLYQFYGDPAGSLPAWIINMFIIDGPYNTFSKLKKLVE